MAFIILLLIITDLDNTVTYVILLVICIIILLVKLVVKVIMDQLFVLCTDQLLFEIMQVTLGSDVDQFRVSRS